MWNVRKAMINKTRYFTYLFISIYKILLFFVCSWIIVTLNGVLDQNNPMNIFNLFKDSFQR